MVIALELRALCSARARAGAAINVTVPPEFLPRLQCVQR